MSVTAPGIIMVPKTNAKSCRCPGAFVYFANAKPASEQRKRDSVTFPVAVITELRKARRMVVSRASWVKLSQRMGLGIHCGGRENISAWFLMAEIRSQ